MEAIRALVEHVVGGGSSGIFVLGGCGEGAWLTPRQRTAVVRGAVRAAAGRVPVQGHESLLAASLLQGADGLGPGLANVAPALIVALRQAAASGD